MTTYTLFQLNEYIRRIMALNLAEPIWVSCEIAQLNVSKGHRYLNLIQKSEETGDIIAQMDAILWESAYRRLRRKRGKSVELIIREGMAVLLQARVEYHERYGLKLSIEDMDPSHSLGQLELQRRQTLEALQQMQLLDKNAELKMPPVIQRIALISSERAAGLQDYLQQLNENPYAYRFSNRLFPARVQGNEAAKEIIRQIEKIQLKATDFDAIVIIRGGGAKLDLLAFDDLALAKTVANCVLPVITGIGHEIDESILDRVAHTALKTPTAVAEFLLQNQLYFESAILQLGQVVDTAATTLLKQQAGQIQQMEQLIQIKSKSDLHNAKRMLEYISKELPKSVQSNLNSHKKQLDQLEQICRLLSPEETLKRGFSLTLHEGKRVQTTKELKEGSIIQTLFQDGSLESEITKINRS